MIPFRINKEEEGKAALGSNLNSEKNTPQDKITSPSRAALWLQQWEQLPAAPAEERLCCQTEL